MNYGNKWQQDQANNTNSLFADLDFAVEIKHPDLPQVPRWNAIERLNREKDLIGIYLSAHPLDEYAYEVKELCNITAQELAQFDNWRKADSRAAAEAQLRTEVNEEGQRPVLPSEFIAAHKNQPCLLGGIIIEAEQRISQKGNPYGRYTIEDYTGGYSFYLFGKAYEQFAHMMLKDLHVLVQGVIQQKNAGQRWFKEAPEEEAEYEFMVQSVQMLNEVQDKRTEGISVRLSLPALTNELMDELAEQIKQSKGSSTLHISIYNPINRQQVAFTSRTPIHVTPALYRWLCDKRMDGVLDFSVVEKK